MNRNFIEDIRAYIDAVYEETPVYSLGAFVDASVPSFVPSAPSDEAKFERAMHAAPSSPAVPEPTPTAAPTPSTTGGFAPVGAYEDIEASYGYEADVDFAIYAGVQFADRAMLSETEPYESLAERLDSLDESFAQTVLRLIDERDMTDVEVYKRANMSRQLFAKIRKDDDYRPTKKTACALVFALGLDYADALALLGRAGFTLSHSSKFDIIIEYFLMHDIHDIYQVNEALYAFDQQLLG